MSLKKIFEYVLIKHEVFKFCRKGIQPLGKNGRKFWELHHVYSMSPSLFWPGVHHFCKKNLLVVLLIQTIYSWCQASGNNELWFLQSWQTSIGKSAVILPYLWTNVLCIWKVIRLTVIAWQLGKCRGFATRHESRVRVHAGTGTGIGTDSPTRGLQNEPKISQNG